MAVVEASSAPIYQQIARKAAQLRQLGLSKVEIARRLGVTDKTVAKAIVWAERSATHAS